MENIYAFLHQGCGHSFMATRVIPVMANGNNVQPVCTEKGALSGKDSNQSALIGAWKMVKFETGTGEELKEIPYTGQLIITDAGTLSAQASNPTKQYLTPPIR